MSARLPEPPRANILRGVWHLAFGRADGLAQFGQTPQAFLASLAPLLAFPLVLAGLVAAEGRGLAALYRLLATACLLLAPPVLSHLLARFWDREPYWLRFATAFNWTQWAIPVAASVLLLAMDALIALGLPHEAAGLLMPYGLFVYALWLHWFLMRHGLQLSPLRAFIGVLLVNLGTGLLFIGPGLIRLLLVDGQGASR